MGERPALSGGEVAVTAAAYDHVWRVRTRPVERMVPGLLGPEWEAPSRFGQRCRVVTRGAKNTILVEFADGARFYTCRYYVRAV